MTGSGGVGVRERLAGVRGWIFDMDGTLVLGDKVNHGLRPLPGAVEMLAWVRSRGVPYVVFTNGTNRAPAHFATVLREAGLDVPDERMMTPASSAAVMFGRRGYKRVMVLGGPGLTEPLRAAGIETVAPGEGGHGGGGHGGGGHGGGGHGGGGHGEGGHGGDGHGGAATVDAVLVGWFPEFTMPALEAACEAVWAGARLYSASETPFFATAGGRALGTSRAISAMIRSVTGCGMAITGKPSLSALRAAADRLGVTRLRDLAVVGDDPLLEVPMAHRGHALAIAVGTGLGSAGAYDRVPPERRPHLHLSGVGELLALVSR